MNEVLGYQHEDNKDMGPGGATKKILPNRKLFHVNIHDFYDFNYMGLKIN
jgi:hypothetical protein